MNDVSRIMCSSAVYLKKKKTTTKKHSPSVACDVKTQSLTNMAATVISGLKIQLGKKYRVTYSPDCL